MTPEIPPCPYCRKYHELKKENPVNEKTLRKLNIQIRSSQFIIGISIGIAYAGIMLARDGESIARFLLSTVLTLAVGGTLAWMGLERRDQIQRNYTANELNELKRQINRLSSDYTDMVATVGAQNRIPKDQIEEWKSRAPKTLAVVDEMPRDWY